MSVVASGPREPAETPATKAKTSAKMARCKAAGGATLGQDNGRDAQRQAAVILEVLAGARTPTQAAAALNVSVPRYYQMETRALRGLVEACEAKPRGRCPSMDKEIAAVRREQERLQRELTRHQSLVRVTQRHLGLTPPRAGGQAGAWEEAASASGGASPDGGKAIGKRPRAVVSTGSEWRIERIDASGIVGSGETAEAAEPLPVS